jgi:hypothetical protein
MDRSVVIIAGVASFAIAGTAHAAPPAWCKGASVGPPDLGRLASKEVKEVIRAFVSAECAPNAEVEAHRGEIEAARQAWSKRLGMTDADWADAIPYIVAGSDYSIRAELSTDVLSAATPLDQYALVMRAGESSSKFDEMYATDMFEADLSEAARFAFLTTTCFDTGRSPTRDPGGMIGTEVLWAICQPDFDRFDLGKLLTEIRGDTAHGGALKMKLRVAAHDFPQRMKDHAVEVQEMLKRDDANRKLFELAASARAEWSSAAGKNGRLPDHLLALVLAMESAQLAQSRKLFDGCSDKTATALADAVSTIPAKAFAGLHDERDDPAAGFGSSAGLVLVRSPAVNLAAIAYTLCNSEGGVASMLKQSLDAGPGLRGPRNAALARIKTAKLTYDKVGATLSFPASRPYGKDYPDGKLAVQSAGGVLKSIKRDGDTLVPELEKTLVKQEDCLKSHSTGRIERVRENGTVVYERVCDRSGTVVHDHTWTGIALAAKYAPWLKPGVVFSAVDNDVIAVWPNKSAKLPSMVLGGTVK